MSAAAHTAILNAIPRAFDEAKASGDLLFFSSDVHRHRDDSGINFHITLCPALLHKPALPTPDFSSPQPVQGSGQSKADPFAPPYNSRLLVGQLKDENEGNEYVVLLNKYSVVPHHFLLVTKEYQSQTTPLRPADLVQAYALLVAASRAGQHYFAFYNCGEHSGASQPHKHVQFIPTDEYGPPIEELTNTVDIEKEEKPFALPKLPFAHHIRRLSISPSARPETLEHTLAEAYVSLLDLVFSTVRQQPNHPSGTPSYNVVLTLRHLTLFPRARESHTLVATGEQLPVNALGFAGMLLVKSEPELRAVQAEGPLNILRSVGCISVHDQQVKGGPELDGDIDHMAA